MPDKIKKSIPWVVFTISAILLIGIGFYSFWFPPRVQADTLTPSVTVGNATPTVSAVSLNDGSGFSLTENVTTSIECTATITDPNNYGDISSATGTVYRSGVGASCTNNDNNCYQLTSSDCPLSSGSGSTKYATCTVDIWFHAESTDGSAPSYSGEWWECQITATDAGSLTHSATNSIETVDLGSSNALIVTGSISYSTMAPGATSSASQEITATTTGNVAIDINVSGTGMATSSYYMATSSQEYATSSVTYGNAEATDLTDSAVALEVDLPKPDTHPSTSTDIIYWRIGVPSEQEKGDYTGTTTIAAKTDA